MKIHIILIVFLFLLTSWTNISAQVDSNKNPWSLLNEQKFDLAEKIFEQRIKKDPTNKNLWSGYLWSLYNNKKYQKIIKLFKNQKLAKNFPELLLIRGWTYYQLNNLELAANDFLEIIEIKNHNVISAVEGLGWIYIKENKTEYFYQKFFLKYEKHLSKKLKKEIYKKLAINYFNKKDYKKSAIFSRKALLLIPKDKKLRQIYFLSLIYNQKYMSARNEIIRGSHIFEKYLNSLSFFYIKNILGKENFSEIQTSFFNRGGKEGEDKLYLETFPLWTNQINFIHKNSFYTLRIESSRKWISNRVKNENYKTIQIIFLQDDKDYPYYSFKLKLGLEPIDATINETISFNIEKTIDLDKQKRAFIKIFREPVINSLTSTVGNEFNLNGYKWTWGRVFKTGVEAKFLEAFDENVSLEISLGAASYTGKNTKDNASFYINISNGYTKILDRNYISSIWVGTFFHFTHFDNNQSFYRIKYKEHFLPAYGHGGYFSPNYLISFGPAISIKSYQFRNFLFEGSLALSLSFYNTEDAYLWPNGLKDEEITMFRDQLQEPFNNQKGFILEGNTSSSIGGSIILKGLYLLTKNLAIGGEFRYLRSADFYECAGLIKMRFYWNKRFGLYFAPYSP